MISSPGAFTHAGPSIYSNSSLLSAQNAISFIKLFLILWIRSTLIPEDSLRLYLKLSNDTIFYLNVHKAYFAIFSPLLGRQHHKIGSVLLIWVPQCTQHSAWHMWGLNKRFQLIWCMCETKNLPIHTQVKLYMWKHL